MASRLLQEDGDKLLTEVGATENILLEQNAVGSTADKSFTLEVAQHVAYLGADEKVFICLPLASDVHTLVTGVATPTFALLKFGTTTFTTVTATWTEVGSGWYTITLTSSMKDTHGPMIIRSKQTTTPTTMIGYHVAIVGSNDEDIAGNVARIRHIQRRAL